MVDQAATPRAVRTLKITIGADTYTKHVRSFTVKPKPNSVSWKGGDDTALFVDSTVDSHEATVIVVHDYDNPDSLYNFMLEHAGEESTWEYNPNAGAFTASVDLVIVPPQIGGDVGKFHESTIAMPCTKPVVVID